MFDKILVVCAGNICRSPIAKEMLSKIMPDKEVDSAGLITQKSNLISARASEPMIQLALDANIDLSTHQAKQLTPELCQWAELILVMEESHIYSVADIASTARSKTFLLGQWSTGTISDPYGKGEREYKVAYQAIEQACESWKKRLK